MAISGLIKQKTEEELRKFPWLADIPILGIFFRGKTYNTGGGRGTLGDSELVVTITPNIIKEETANTETKIETSAGKKEEGVVREGTNLRVPSTVKEDVSKGKSKANVSSNETKVSTMSGYVRTIIKRIQENVDYPWAAKEGQLQGSLKLALRIDNSGQLLEVDVKKSSGFSVFDENAVSVVKKLAPYPPFPPEIKEKELQIDVPIIYKIN